MAPRRIVFVLAALAALVAAPLASASPAHSPFTVDQSCFAPATHPAPGSAQWQVRDQLNQYCATLRLRDQFTNPAYGTHELLTGDALYLAQAKQQAADGPGHVHGGVTTLIPGSQGADAFRSIKKWREQTGGRVQAVTFTASDGAQIHGHLWLPPVSESRPAAGYPGIVITNGSIQAYENLYYWAAEGLAQYGYEVLTYDVQGEGDSDLFPAKCRPQNCPGVPYQQNYNFYQGAEDSLGFFDSPANPGYRLLNTNQIGIAGHSLGASAVSWVGQCDNRVRAIVAWDDLIPVDTSECAANVNVPAAYRATALHAPALAITNDYEFNTQPQPTAPDPHGSPNGGGLSGDSGYLSLADAGIDSELISIRNGTHLTYSYIPYVLPANELGERFAFYYTLAWFDEYVRAGANPFTPVPAYQRLTTLATYDASADRNSNGIVSIGTGTFNPKAAAADPTSPYAGNTPYRINGVSIRNSLSFYYYSQYHVTEPGSGVLHTCSDMLAGCPATQPPTP